ncbi:MAG: hypothetical protein ACK559_27340, partial [bacterium]
GLLRLDGAGRAHPHGRVCWVQAVQPPVIGGELQGAVLGVGLQPCLFGGIGRMGHHPFAERAGIGPVEEVVFVPVEDRVGGADAGRVVRRQPSRRRRLRRTSDPSRVRAIRLDSSR